MATDNSEALLFSDSPTALEPAHRPDLTLEDIPEDEDGLIDLVLADEAGMLKLLSELRSQCAAFRRLLGPQVFPPERSRSSAQPMSPQKRQSTTASPQAAAGDGARKRSKGAEQSLKASKDKGKDKTH
jgi:hypothetical protein